MPEIRGRKETSPLRTRQRLKTEDSMEDSLENPSAPTAVEMPDPPAAIPHAEPENYGGFDEETNNRYEEIKRGSTHISELQQMTMPQLLKTAKEEGL